VLLASVGQAAAETVLSGPLLLAAVLALAAGLVSFVSPCCLPLVPAYLSYVAGAAGPTSEGAPGAAPSGAVLTKQRSQGRVVLGTGLFVLGFAAVFTSYGALFGGIGFLLLEYQDVVVRVLGAVTILLGLLFAGVLTGVPGLARTVRPTWRPRAGLAGAPVLGVLFGVGWTPCIGPTLAAVLTLATSAAGAERGALLAFVYSLGLGLPFLTLAAGFARATAALAVLRRHTRTMARVGGLMLVVLGLLQLSGLWTSLMARLQGVIAGYSVPL
jgi:cytochrome c-type biogenesis protein